MWVLLEREWVCFVMTASALDYANVMAGLLTRNDRWQFGVGCKCSTPEPSAYAHRYYASVCVCVYVYVWVYVLKLRMKKTKQQLRMTSHPQTPDTVSLSENHFFVALSTTIKERERKTKIHRTIFFFRSFVDFFYRSFDSHFVIICIFVLANKRYENVNNLVCSLLPFQSISLDL